MRVCGPRNGFIASDVNIRLGCTGGLKLQSDFLVLHDGRQRHQHQSVLSTYNRFRHGEVRSEKVSGVDIPWQSRSFVDISLHSACYLFVLSEVRDCLS